MTKINIIEDDKDTRVFYKFLLGKKYDLEFFDCADGFFDSLITSGCDLIIADLKLKGEEDGFSIIKRLKGTQGFSAIPVLCLTAYVFEEYKQQAFRAGADYFLTKPVENWIFLNTIEMLLNKNRAYFSAVI